MPVLDRITIDQFSIYQKNRIPAIIGDLFSTQGINNFQTADSFVKKFSKVKFQLKDEYSILLHHLMMKGDFPSMRSITMSLEECINYFLDNPHGSLMVINQKTPDEFIKLMNFPACFNQENSNYESFMFLGNKGKVAHLHFDRDQRNVLLYQVLGIKKIVIIHPMQTWQLKPIANFSQIFLNSLCRVQQYHFINNQNAWIGELNAGDTVYIPALYWHYLEYNEISFSINFRLQCSEFNNFLADNVFSNYKLQLIGHHLNGLATYHEKNDIFQKIAGCYYSHIGSAIEKYRKVDTVLQEIYTSICNALSIKKCISSDSNLEEKFVHEDIKFRNLYKSKI